MSKAPGKRAIKALIKEHGVWTHTDSQGRRWDIANDALYCDYVWQCACANHDALKSIATWEE